MGVQKVAVFSQTLKIFDKNFSRLTRILGGDSCPLLYSSPDVTAIYYHMVQKLILIFLPFDGG